MVTRGPALPWWRQQPGERFWLEVTKRTDIGARLWNYTTSTSGQVIPSTALLEEMEEGDVVFHYGAGRSIVAASTVSGQRAQLGQDSGQDILSRAIRDTQWFRYPITLDELRAAAPAILAAQDIATDGARGAKYLPFHEDAKGLRPNVPYIAKLPRGVVEALPRLAAWGTDDPARASRRPSAAYRQADEHVSSKRRTPFAVDPDAYDRSHRGHNRTQNRLAQMLRDRGIEPCSPDLLDPAFDLGFRTSGAFWVVEVKSTTGVNEEHQLRLGLGQVLRYAHALGSRHGTVRAVLVAERAPSDRSWHAACAAVGVVLSSGPGFRELARVLDGKEAQ